MKNDLAVPPLNLKDWPANLVKELNLEGNMAADDSSDRLCDFF